MWRGFGWWNRKRLRSKFPDGHGNSWIRQILRQSLADYSRQLHSRQPRGLEIAEQRQRDFPVWSYPNGPSEGRLFPDINLNDIASRDMIVGITRVNGTGVRGCCAAKTSFRGSRPVTIAVAIQARKTIDANMATDLLCRLGNNTAVGAKIHLAMKTSS